MNYATVEMLEVFFWKKKLFQKVRRCKYLPEYIYDLNVGLCKLISKKFVDGTFCEYELVTWDQFFRDLKTIANDTEKYVSFELPVEEVEKIANKLIELKGY
jgi:hypothetical protein